MGADTPPEDVRLTRRDLGPILERRAAVRRPRHLEDAGGALNPRHTQAFAEAAARPQVVHELLDRDEEGRLLGRG